MKWLKVCNCVKTGVQHQTWLSMQLPWLHSHFKRCLWACCVQNQGLNEMNIKIFLLHLVFEKSFQNISSHVAYLISTAISGWDILLVLLFGWNDLIGRWIFGKQIIFSECFEYWGSNFGEIRSAMPAQRIKIPNNFPIFGNPAHSNFSDILGVNIGFDRLTVSRKMEHLIYHSPYGNF